MSEEYPDNWLHVYGQYSEHDDACIRGTKGGLEVLRAAIDKALIEKEAEADVVATDGEGYSVKVQLSNTINGVGTPEYIYSTETEVWRRAVARWSVLGRPTNGWETSRNMARLARLNRWWREPATKTDYLIGSIILFAALSAIVLWS